MNFAYISDAQIGHGFLDGDIAHHLTSDDEFLGDTQGEFIVDQELYCQPLAQGNPVPLTTVDEYIEAMERHEFNTPVDSDTTPVVTIPVINTTKEDSTMSQPKTDPNHRPVITQNEEGTQVHMNVEQLSSDTQARLSYREVFDLAKEMAATTLTHQDQARAQIARFHVQNMRNKGRTWIKASSWNAAINDETKIAQVEKKLHAKFVRELAKKARRNPTIYKVTWNQLIEAIRNPDNADPKLNKILSRTTVGRDVVVNKAQFDQITSLAA